MPDKKMNLVISEPDNLDILAYYYWSHKSPVVSGARIFTIVENKLGCRPETVEIIDALDDKIPLYDNDKELNIVGLGRSYCMEIVVDGEEIRNVCL